MTAPSAARRRTGAAWNAALTLASMNCQKAVVPHMPQLSPQVPCAQQQNRTICLSDPDSHPGIGADRWKSCGVCGIPPFVLVRRCVADAACHAAPVRHHAALRRLRAGSAVQTVMVGR